MWLNALALVFAVAWCVALIPYVAGVIGMHTASRRHKSLVETRGQYWLAFHALYALAFCQIAYLVIALVQTHWLTAFVVALTIPTLFWSLARIAASSYRAYLLRVRPFIGQLEPDEHERDLDEHEPVEPEAPCAAPRASLDDE